MSKDRYLAPQVLFESDGPVATSDRDGAATADAPALSQAGEFAVHADGPRVAVGQILAGRYRLCGLLGQGGNGAVFEAHDDHLDAVVAIKLVRHDLASPAQIERLRQELRLARKVSHPAVCRVFDVGRHDGVDGPVWFITMERLRGETLAARIARAGRLAPAAVRPLAAELAAGLAAAHAVGVIHRDLTPANVFLVAGADGEHAVITDFGLAVAAADGSHDRPTAGTPAYMAPEQVEGRPATPATDVFALGAVLFHAVTGEPPWRGATGLATARLRLTGPTPRPSARVAGLPPAMDRLIVRCLARAPADRPVATALGVDQHGRGTARRGVRVGAVVGAVAIAAAVVVVMAGRRAPSTVRRPVRGAGDAPSVPAGLAAVPPVTPDLAGPVTHAFTLAIKAGIVEGVAVLPDGDLVVAGHGWPPMDLRGADDGRCGESVRCGFLARLAPTGEQRWVRILDAAGDIKIHAPVVVDGAVVVGGDVTGRAWFADEAPPAVAAASFVATFAVADGSLGWFRRLEVPDSHVRAVAVAADGAIYASGDADRALGWDGAWRDQVAPPHGAGVGFLVALDRDGAERWVETVAGRAKMRFLAVAVVGRQVVWSGSSEGPMRARDGTALTADRGGVLLALDRSTGARRWSRDLTKGGHVTAIADGGDGTAVIAGWFSGTVELDQHAVTSRGAGDAWVGRVDDATGRLAWLTRFGGEDWDSLTSVTVTARAIWAAGRSDGFVDGALAAPRTGTGVALVAQVGLDGTPRRAWSFGGSQYAKARGIDRDAAGAVWVTGNFRLDLDAGTFHLTGLGQNDGFALRLDAR